jgi:insertion element IS1 protein InsB
VVKSGKVRGKQRYKCKECGYNFVIGDARTNEKNCIFYTDNRNAFADILPPERRIIGKSGTHAIERDNSNTRRHLGRFTRRTKIVSKSPAMVDLSIRLWCALTKPEIFRLRQSQMMYIFR